MAFMSGAAGAPGLFLARDRPAHQQQQAGVEGAN